MREWHDLPAVFGAKELAEFLGVERGAAYELCRRKGFPALKVGKKYRISREAFRRWFEEQALKEKEGIRYVNN